MVNERERARKREAQLASVFTAIDTLDEAKTALGDALTQLRDLGVPRSDLPAKTGLSAREVTSALRSATNASNDAEPTAGQTGPSTENKPATGERQ